MSGYRPMLVDDARFFAGDGHLYRTTATDRDRFDPRSGIWVGATGRGLSFDASTDEIDINMAAEQYPNAFLTCEGFGPHQTVEDD